MMSLKSRGLEPWAPDPRKEQRHGRTQMQTRSTARRAALFVGASLASCLFASAAMAAGPEIVTGPNSDPECFAPWGEKTKLFKFPAKPGPYRVALANGYIANTWRIQMIKTAKAYAAQPDVAAKLKEFKVVSTGRDVPGKTGGSTNSMNPGTNGSGGKAKNPPPSRRASSAPTKQAAG